MKRKMSGLFLAVLMLVLSTFSCLAKDVSAETAETEEYLGKVQFETEEVLGNIEDMELKEAEEGTAKAALSFGGAIASGGTFYSESTYHMSKGEGYSYSVTWAPTGQTIKIVRINVATGTVYGTSAKSGGSASGYVSGGSVPAGEYQFGVYNAGSQTITTCTCSINF